jgi:hypothetical protein
MSNIDDRKFACFRRLALAIACIAILAGAVEIGLTAPAIADDTAVDAQLKKIVTQLQSQEKQLADQERRLKRQQDDLAAQAALIASQRQELAQLRGADSQHVEVSTIDASGGITVDSRNASSSSTEAGRADATRNAKLISEQIVGPATAASDTLSTKRIASASLATEKPNFLMSPLQLSQNQNTPVTSDNTPSSPVGEAPSQGSTVTEAQANEVVQSLPVGLAVLTPPQHFIFSPSVEYTQTTNDQLVYEGVVIVPGVDLGEITASTDDRSIISAVADVRYGIFNHFEVEARVPYTFSDDRATLLTQGPNSSATQSMYISNNGFGDIQLAGRYQINDGLDDWPVFVANAVVKTDTGLGPFDVARNSAGIAEQVAIGSGFWAIQGGFSALKVSDPAVLYASANYIYQIPKDVNKTIGGVYVGNVDPSNAVSAAFGFGFAVNSTFSFSLGYEHSFVFPQETELGGTQQQTTSLEVGALTMGMAYRLAPNMSLNSNFEFGVTHDAPNMHVVFSLPISY